MLTRPLLFLSSYAGLFVILMIRFHESAGLVIVFWIASEMGLAAPLVLLRSRRHAGGDPFEVSEVEDRGPEVAGYLATYLLPFVTVPRPDIYDLAGYGLFVVLAAIVYVQSEMVQINPTFYLLRWRVFAFSSPNGRRFYLLSRNRPARGSAIRAWRVTDDVLLDVQLGG